MHVKLTICPLVSTKASGQRVDCIIMLGVTFPSGWLTILFRPPFLIHCICSCLVHQDTLSIRGDYKENSKNPVWEKVVRLERVWRTNAYSKVSWYVYQYFRSHYIWFVEFSSLSLCLDFPFTSAVSSYSLFLPDPLFSQKIFVPEKWEEANRILKWSE